MNRLAAWWCRRKGHDWMFDHEPYEFIPCERICLRCGKTEIILPTGTCLGDHPMADHYLTDTRPVATADCPGPW